jgi:hypothetical protein
MPELDGEVHERPGFPERRPALRDLGLEEPGQGEVLQDGQDVGEPFMEGQRIWSRGGHGQWAQFVQERVARLVVDDVVGHAAVHPRAGEEQLWVVGSDEGPEGQALTRGVEGVCRIDPMREHRHRPHPGTVG